MSEQTNLAIIQGVYEAFGRGDIPSILSKVAPGVRWESWADNTAQAAGVPVMLRREDLAGVGAFFGVVGSLQITDFRVLNLMAGGDKVAAEFFIAMTLPNGKSLADEEIHLWTLNDAGQITGLRHYLDTHKHIEAWK
jgi:hypothetical protein